MQKQTNITITVGMTIILSLLQISLSHAEPMHLKSGNTRFPVVIDFPIAPQTGYMPNPTLANSMIYYFTAQDEDASVAYAVTIISIPASLGSIPNDTAQTMIDHSLSTQISSVDAAVGAKGKVIGANSEPLAGNPSKCLEVVRQTTPRLFGSYRAVFVNRLLITVWATGLDTADNRSQATAFVQGLQITSWQDVREEARRGDKTKYFQLDTAGQWVEIPDEAISAYSEEIHRQTGQMVDYLIGYARTSESRTNWFDLPFILVISDEKGKFPQEKLDEIVKKSGDRLQEGLGDLKDALPSLQVGDMSYEKSRQIIWIELVSDVPHIGKVHSITAMMLTETGTLNFTLYVVTSDRDTRLKEFSVLLNRVRLDPAFVYQSVKTDDTQ